jgi:hypothetical protein
MWRMRHVPNVKRCCVCFVKVPLGLTFGRCAACGRGMAPAYRDYLQGLSREERELEYNKTADHHPRPKWTYENEAGEAELIAETEKQNKETTCP